MLNSEERKTLLELLDAEHEPSRLVFRAVCLPANGNGGDAARLPTSADDCVIILLQKSSVSNAQELVAGRQIAGRMKHLPLIGIGCIILVLAFCAVSLTVAFVCGIVAMFLITTVARSWWGAYAEATAAKPDVEWTAICAPETEAELPRLLYPYLQAGWETVNRRDRPHVPFIMNWTPDDVSASIREALSGIPNATNYDYDYVRQPDASSGIKGG